MNSLKESYYQEYITNGYVIVKNLLDKQELEHINSEISELFKIQLDHLGLPIDNTKKSTSFLDNASSLLKENVSTYINTARMTQMLPSVHKILLSREINDLVIALGVEFPVLSTRTSIHIMADQLKVPGGYHKTPPHQDWRSIQGSLDNIVLWIPTTIVTENTHPLEIVPKSHLLGLLQTKEHIMTPMVDDPRISEDMYIALPVEPGDVIAFSSFLVHKTGDEGDGTARIALSGRFNNAKEKTFIEHGFPSPYTYSYRKDLMFSHFPEKDHLVSVYPDALKENELKN